MVKRIGVVGLGYVGLPLAVAFAERIPVLGFDVDQARILNLAKGIDETKEVSRQQLLNAKIEFSSDPRELQGCDFIIVAVPTPIDKAKQPDLVPLKRASEIVGNNMSIGTTVVYESTVYPGTTEEVCIPILEHTSGFTAGEGFFVGYSPERINPGDKEHTIKSIVKIVSGQDENTLMNIADTYGMIVQAGVYRAPSIRVAEAAKVIENTQRDLNIAFMNELSIIFEKLGINTNEVLKAASTKWNFLNFKPGLVGGHCIGVDPYYLTYKAESVGYHPQVILAGRRINDSMGQFIAVSVIKQLILQGKIIQGAKVTVLGVTFKENVPDIRNSKVMDIVQELISFGIDVEISDPLADYASTKREYDIDLVPMTELSPSDAVIVAVPHRAIKDLGLNGIVSLLKDNKGIVADVKSVFNKGDAPDGVVVWSL